MTRFTFGTSAAAAALVSLLPMAGLAQSAEDLMVSTLGTAEADPVIMEAMEHAAEPVTEEMRAKALECWNNNSCDTGTGGDVTVAYADGFGENVWRRVTAMEFIQQALTYPEIGEILYTSARGDAAKAISDLRAYIAQGVDVIVVFADAGEALAPVVREATEAGIKVVLHNGTGAGVAGEDYLTNISENICDLGTEMVRAIASTNHPGPIVALGGVPGNPLSAEVQRCANIEIDNTEGLEMAASIDTMWTQEGNVTATSTALSQYGEIGGYITEYADGFRGALRAYEQAGLDPVFTVASRTDEQGLFCDWEDAGKSFDVFYSSGQNYQSRFALTAAMMAIEGEEVAPVIEVPFSMKPATDELCNPELPMETSVSTLVDTETLKQMFAGN
ncbi:substrate-binding domain-containing protein [Pseudoroseicyclus sp. H15]